MRDKQKEHHRIITHKTDILQKQKEYQKNKVVMKTHEIDYWGFWIHRQNMRIQWETQPKQNTNLRKLMDYGSDVFFFLSRVDLHSNQAGGGGEGGRHKAAAESREQEP